MDALSRDIPIIVGANSDCCISSRRLASPDNHSPDRAIIKSSSDLVISFDCRHRITDYSGTLVIGMYTLTDGRVIPPEVSKDELLSCNTPQEVYRSIRPFLYTGDKDRNISLVDAAFRKNFGDISRWISEE